MEIILCLTACILIAVAVLCGSRTSWAQDSSLQLMYEIDGGKLYQTGPVNVLELRGNYRKMGRQYGKLLGFKIIQMHDEIVKQYSENKVVVPYQSLEEFSYKQFLNYPQRFKEIIYGISETSAIDIKKIAIINEFYNYILLFMTGPPHSCSAITAWGEYTNENHLIMGRNFDFPAFFAHFNRFLTVVAYNPEDGAHSSAVLTYAGQIGSINAFNEAGLTLINNDGSCSGDQCRPTGRVSFLIQALQVMLDSSNLQTLCASLNSFRAFYPLIYIVADAQKAIAYETTTLDIQKEEGDSAGLLVITNHFVSRAWGKSRHKLGDIGFTLSRRKNLLNLAKKHKGDIDAGSMMEIMDTQLKQGGATIPGVTIYQFVAVPQELTLWVKALGFMEWTEINFGQLF